MRRIAICLMVLVTSALSANAAPIDLWYNGNFDNASGLANELNTAVTDSRVYSNFRVTDSAGWDINNVYSNNLATGFTPTTAYWEIRSGVSAGNGGVLVASGTDAATWTPTGNSGFGLTEFTAEVSGLDVYLAQGDYWLTVAPVGNGSGRSFQSTTTGTGSIGLFLPGDSFWDSTFFGQTFTDTNAFFGGGLDDFSAGVRGQVAVVPEPMSMVVFGGLAVAGIAGYRRRNQAKA